MTISDRGSPGNRAKHLVVLQRQKTTAAPQSRNWSAVNVPVATPTGTAPACARDVVQRIANDEDVCWRKRRHSARRCPLKCDGHEALRSGESSPKAPQGK